MQRRGFILTGGRSSRLGHDKALLPMAERTVVEHLADVAASADCAVTLVGAPGRYRHLGIPCIPDLRPGLGPLSGIEAALLHAETERSLILACDLPGITSALLNRLFDTSESTDAGCVCVRDSASRVHPLCAIYRRQCLAPVQAALNCGKLRLMNLLDEISTIYVDADVVLANINTPAEWASFSCR